MLYYLMLLATDPSPGDVTLPWAAWSAIALTITSAAALLFKTYRESVQSNAAQIAALVREVVVAITTNSDLLRNHTDLLKDLMTKMQEKN